MRQAPGRHATLSAWLDYIALLHPREIELGLERGATVLAELDLGRLAPRIVTVAGSNGKGSCVHALSQGLRRRGLRVGSFTSPHIHRFNERIQIDGQEADDRAIVEALCAIESARGAVSLSYFEFATLAAFWLFARAGLDAVVLEVGLGGRLDAVNLVDSDLAIITSISLDHVDWLGPDRESIGQEKAGILRPATALICGDREVPTSITRRAEQLGSPLFLIARDFDIEPDANSETWRWWGRGADGEARQVSGITQGRLWQDNFAIVLQALALLGEEADQQMASELTDAVPPGRLELTRDRDSAVPVLLDVAHNEAGIALLMKRLQALCGDAVRVRLVLAIMADKDVMGMLAALQTRVDIWYIAQVDETRCLPAGQLAEKARAAGIADDRISEFASASAAYRAATGDAKRSADRELIVVTGSFYTVAAVRAYTLTDPSNQPAESGSMQNSSGPGAD